MNYRQHIAIIYIAVIILAIMVSSVIFANNKASQKNHEQLFNTTLPLLQSIRHLQESKTEYERLLYEYYATTDRPRLLPKLELANQAIYLDSNKIIYGSENEATIEAIMLLFNTMKNIAKNLDKNLSEDVIDWNLARDQLFKISNASAQMDPHMNKLIRHTQQQAEDGSANSLSRSQLSSDLVIAFCTIITGLALFIGYYINRYLQEAAYRKRLSMFAERNPNPIISCDQKGQIIYANPSSQALLTELKINHDNWREFLPQIFDEKVDQAFSNNSGQANGKHSINDRIFKYSLSALKDLQTAHVYFEDITDTIETKRKLNFQAQHDPLTQLPNRLSLEITLEKYLKIHARDSVHLVLINIHRFDRVTSIYGYQFGDAIIKHFASTASQVMLSHKNHILGGKPYRIDGTTFGLVITDAKELQSITQKIIDINKKPIHENGNDFYLTVKLGCSHFPEDGTKLNELIKSADSALLQAKRDDAQSLRHYNADLHNTELHLAKIEQQLRNSIADITLFYQPKIDAVSTKICGAEALMRWPSKTGFQYTPDEFIPVAEQSGLIIPMGENAIRLGIEQLLNWSPASGFRLAINLSGAQFQHPDFLPKLTSLIKPHHGIEKFLEFEITESMLMNNVKQSINIMKQLKSMGFLLSIDDFGTGYSSLSYLKDFPIDKLKIDRSFVMNIETQQNDQTMVRSIVSLAHSLGLKVVAEGVETEQQFEYLKSLNCEEIQGYLFSKPLTENEFNRSYFS